MIRWTPSCYGYFHGRFQPFHLGHLDVVKQALTDCAQLVLGISNPFRLSPIVEKHFCSDAERSLLAARNPENNPWPYWARVLMIHEGLRKEGLDLSRIVFMPNLSNTGLPVEEMRLPKSLTTVYLCPKGDHNLTALRKYRKDGWRVVEVVNSPKCPSAGIIRGAIRSGSRWEQFVPEGTRDVIKWYATEFAGRG